MADSKAAIDKDHVVSRAQLPVEIWHEIVDVVDSSPSRHRKHLDPFKSINPDLGLGRDVYDPSTQTNPLDLKALRLVNKTFNVMVSPKLFRNMVIRPFESNATAWVDKLLAFSQTELMRCVETVWIWTSRRASVTPYCLQEEHSDDSDADHDTELCFRDVWGELWHQLGIIGPRFANLKAVMTDIKNYCGCGRGCEGFDHTFVADFLKALPAKGLVALSVAPNVFEILKSCADLHALPIKLSTIQRLALDDNEAGYEYGIYGRETPEWWGTPPELIQTFSNVKVLSLRDVPCMPVTSCRHLTKLCSLRLSEGRWSIEALHKLIENSESTLKHIVINDVFMEMWDQTIQEGFRGRPFKALESLTMSFQLLEPDTQVLSNPKFHWEAKQGRERLNTWIESEEWDET